ncbi:LysR substrate-binding domain-containing protein [Leisingera sp. ANG-Vp]|uniref:LysR substrate-binding domain-containing protein n=1 Tax=Leisingera sp. ANG-Vp TaxID=1577896 RepID=UPI00058079F4|nr:LysR substrate-binding domain-containing protein [Leisingera sp. ANG-Vp]KIC21322.1 LysR family transcriptional regulator [Leisingera sp. ANG-Vp]
MMNLPHLTFLRSFEASARHSSFTSAAEELNCTQSAVSNHVRSLEEFIGRPLFVRHPRSLSLTDVGEAYVPSVRHALQEIDVATQSLVLQKHKREVVVSCPFSLAENWLPKVVQSFRRKYPEIDLTIHGTIWTDVEENVSDISISTSHLEDVTPNMLQLWEEKLTIVCSPNYLVDGRPFDSEGQLCRADLIHILGRPVYWELVAKHIDAQEVNLKSGFSTNASNIALELAAQGLGCIALPRSLVMPYIQRGLLFEPFELDVVCPWTYFVKVVDKMPTPSVKLFHSWLMLAAGTVEG